MNFADIENVWRSPHNRPSPAAIEEIKMKFVTDLKKRRRSQLMLLLISFAPLAFFTGKILIHLLRPDPALDPVDLTREWGIVPFFALPWLGWLYLVYLYRGHRARHADYNRSVRAMVAALLDDNRMERRRQKAIGVLLVASALVLPLIVYQLRAVGKAGDEILIPALVIYPGYVLAVVVWAAVHHRRKLLPRKRELEALLASYE
jgi:hypothetical protein